MKMAYLPTPDRLELQGGFPRQNSDLHFCRFSDKIAHMLQTLLLMYAQTLPLLPVQVLPPPAVPQQRYKMHRPLQEAPILSILP